MMSIEQKQTFYYEFSVSMYSSQQNRAYCYIFYEFIMFVSMLDHEWTVTKARFMAKGYFGSSSFWMLSQRSIKECCSSETEGTRK